MLGSSNSSGSQEVHKDEHVNVDEVSDPSIANQDLPPKKRRLHRLSKITRGPAELRWTNNKIQRFFTAGQSLQDVAANLRHGAVQPSERPMIGIVRHGMKRYSRNKPSLRCFKAAKADSVEICMSSVDTAFLHGLTTQTDGLHLTACPCKSTSTSEVISKLHEWMDTFQMNPKAICADMAFHHPHEMQASYRMHNVKRIPTGPQTPWPQPSRNGCTTVQEISLGTRGYSFHKPELDHSGTDHSCPIDAQGGDSEKYPDNFKCKTPVELAMGRRPVDLVDPASLNPERLTSTPTKQDLLNEEIFKNWP